ncbi:MAG: hypothetical protein MRK02_06340 [Candidatus Scalindua sp.]|nr:hypothetical protein [Candidatus Scalindua sp.]
MLIALLPLGSSFASTSFDSWSFIDGKTSFFTDFEEFREEWFTIEKEVFEVDDVYATVNWPKIANRAKNLVEKHEQLMVKFVKESQSAINKLKNEDISQGTAARKNVLEFIDSVGLVVLKLYEITEKLSKKTKDPYSYTMRQYNLDIEHYKKLYDTFQTRGSELNKLFYGK